MGEEGLRTYRPSLCLPLKYRPRFENPCSRKRTEGGSARVRMHGRKGEGTLGGEIEIGNRMNEDGHSVQTEFKDFRIGERQDESSENKDEE